MGGVVKWVDENVLGNEEEEKEDPHAAAKLIDPNTGEYGGRAGVGDEAANRYGQTSQGFLKSAGDLYAGGAEERGRAFEDRNRALQARGDQNAILQMQLDRARGNGPSIADMQAQRDMQRVLAGQQSMAASARGPAALAMAQQNAAAGAAAGQANISGQAQINAAQERERAEQAAAQTAGQMRGQDYGGQQLSYTGQQILYNAAGQQNQGALGFAGLEQGVRQSQQQGGVDRAALQTGQYNAAQARNAQGRSEGNQRRTGIGMGIIGAVSQGAGTVAGDPSDARAKRGINPISMADFIGHSEPMVKSTWGTGPDMSESDVDEYHRRVADAGADVDRREAAYQKGRSEAEAALNSNSSLGPMAVAGVNGQGQFVQPDNALRRVDDERRMELRSREEHGIEPTEREEAEARVLARRSGEERRAPQGQPGQGQPGQAAANAQAQKPGVGSALKGVGSEFMDLAKGMLRGGGSGGAYAAYMPQPRSDEFAKVGVRPLGMSMNQPMNGHMSMGNEVANRNPSNALINGGGGLGGTNINSKWSKMLAMRPPGSDRKAKTNVSAMDDNAEARIWAMNALKSGGGRNVVGLEDPDEGVERHWDRDVASAAPARSTADGGASLSGPAPAPGRRRASAAQESGGDSEKPKPKPQPRRPTNEEAARWAEAELAKTRAAQEQLPSQGPSVVDPLAPAPWLRKYMSEEMSSDMSTKVPFSSDERAKRAVSSVEGSDDNPIDLDQVQPTEATEAPHEFDPKRAGFNPIGGAGRVAVEHKSTQAMLDYLRSKSTDEDRKRRGEALTRGVERVKAAVQPAVTATDRAYHRAAQSVGAEQTDTQRQLAETEARIQAQKKFAEEVAANSRKRRTIENEGRELERAPREERLSAADFLSDMSTKLPDHYSDMSTKLPDHYSDERAKRVIGGEQRMANANRSQEGYSYQYKDQFRPPDQAPGERNVGPMAQEMAADPTARTAVKKEPSTGLLTLDRDKMLKLHGAGLASVQKQIDELYRVLGRDR